MPIIIQRFLCTLRKGRQNDFLLKLFDYIIESPSESIRLLERAAVKARESQTVKTVDELTIKY